MTTQEEMIVLDNRVEAFKDFVLDAVEKFFSRATEAQKDHLRSALGSVDFAKCETYADLCQQQDNIINDCLKGE